jgi:NAD-dependent deacetylase
MVKAKVVVLTGAGISAESGLSTFRDNNGLWDQYRIEDVATPEAFAKDPETVLEFYNKRRQQLGEVAPNEGHHALAELEEAYSVAIVTQNVDDLHERAGSTQVHHLHGRLQEACSEGDPSLVYDIGYGAISLGDKCDKGYQLRPNIVWFGEAVPKMPEAAQLFSEADAVLVIGTSLLVYPAAGLLDYASPEVPKYYIDPKADQNLPYKGLEVIQEKASEGVPQVVKRLKTNPLKK